jgi:hypothetical protein
VVRTTLPSFHHGTNYGPPPPPFSVVDPHRFDADLDPNFLVDADLDPNFLVDADLVPDRHQNDADPHADPTPSFTNVGNWKIRIFSFRLVVLLPVYNVLSFSSVSNVL